MKTKSTLLAVCLTALTLSATAQIVPDPAGTNTFTAASAFNMASYQASLGSLYFDSNANVPSPAVNSWSFVTQTSDVFTSSPWLAGGGTVKTIFLGESAASLNDFGYVVAGSNLASSASYKHLATNIDNNNGSIASGWETLVNYGAGERLDFWVNNPGTFAPGGAYFGFLEAGVGSAFAGGDPYAHTKFAWTSVMTEYQDANGVTVRGNVNTLLLAYEDLRGPVLPPGGGLPTIPPGDGDYTDFLVAFQFLPTQVAVPEPSTYGLIGAGALLALAGYRRFKKTAAQSAA
jgi:hypothetical protein